MNDQLSRKWAAINQEKKAGQMTGRATVAPAMPLAQTINMQSSSNNLNMSTNKFQSRIASKNMGAPSLPSGNAFKSNLPTNNQPQTGIQHTSFRNRIKGLQQPQQFGNQIQASTMIPGSGSANPSASNSDLQKKLADMKAKLQGFKKKE